MYRMSLKSNFDLPWYRITKPRNVASMLGGSSEVDKSDKMDKIAYFKLANKVGNTRTDFNELVPNPGKRSSGHSIYRALEI